MILKETILSAFTERGTLLKWLKKVEAALNNAVLTDISVEQVSATQVKLKFTFENGDFVESPVLTLPRGEKGEPGKDGAPGKDGLDGEGIAATIEVGTVTTGAAGTDASVTNVGTEQRAILNFVIPRGDTGASGEQGSAGVGFDDADFISINDGAINITAGDNGVNIEASFEVAVGEEVLEIPASMYLPLKGSESIVIDVDESGDFIDIHLDADIAAKLGRVLVTPMSAPASVSLVAVDTSNAQTLLTLGDGLSVSNGVLSASGGGGGATISANTGYTPKNILDDITINGVTYIIPNSNTISIRVTNSSNSTHSIKPLAWKGQVISGDDTFISPGEERYIYVTYGTLLEFEVENASVSAWLIDEINDAVIVGGPVSPSVLVYTNASRVTLDAYDGD